MPGLTIAAVMFGAGLAGGALNAAAGGGSFVTLPALLYAGLPGPLASASSTAALFPGRVASAWVFRRELRAFDGAPLGAMLAASLAGGLTGAVLLLHTSPARFDRVLPWLLLAATVAFAVGGPRVRGEASRSARTPAALLAGQFLVCAYAGYFGGAAGILLLGLWSVTGLTDVRAMNAAKTILLAVANTASVALFAAGGAVRWPLALPMLAGAMLGGWGGAQLTRRLAPRSLRIGLTAFNVAVTGLFFLRAAG